MALLARAAALAVLAGCYSPDLRDCTVTCATSADCAGTQVCGADHFCARPAKAGTCRATLPDAGAPTTTTTTDAATAADASTPDAPPLGTLEVIAMGHGQLVVGSHACAMDCTYMLPVQPTDVVAVAGGDWKLDSWTIGPCVGSHSTTCTVTPPATVGARFRKGGH